MNRITQIIGRIEALTGGHVDCGPLGGRNSLIAQAYYLQNNNEEVNSTLPVDSFITHLKESLDEIYAYVKPFHLPVDYTFFLEFYGGFLLEKFDYNLIIDGIGPMVEEWYGFLLGDDGVWENGLLGIATLVFKEDRIGQRVRFFLDLAGTICQYCVISINNQNLVEVDQTTVLQNPRAYPTRWEKVADSFTEWLEQVAETEGTFGYV